ncbi:Asuc [Acrasis kona]|uniref:Asuc n=1 Tax=Acrasis kona TaxID=1008807 RepID=A0AAW2YSG0_9EUKA
MNTDKPRNHVKFSDDNLVDVHLIDNQLPPIVHLSNNRANQSSQSKPETDNNWRISNFVTLQDEPNGFAGHSLSYIVHEEQRGLIVYGGVNTQGDNTSHQSNVYFISQDGKWRNLCTLPEKFFRYDHSTEVSKNHRYAFIFGGAGVDNQPNNETIVFDFEKKNVNFLNVSGSIPSPRVKHASTIVCDHYLIVHGGYDPVNKVHLNDTYSLNLQTREWSAVKIIGNETPTPRSSHSMTPLSTSRFLLLGGLNIDSILIDMWSVQFNPQDNSATWTKSNITEDDIPPLFGHTCHRIDTNLFVLGGCKYEHSTRQLSTLIYELDFKNVTETKSYTSPVTIRNIPCDAPPRMYHSSQVVGKEIIVVGGRLVGVTGNEPNQKYDNGGYVLQHK